jgi:lipopolysaccharide export LptBFGC system permease protein LptF
MKLFFYLTKHYLKKVFAVFIVVFTLIILLDLAEVIKSFKNEPAINYLFLILAKSSNTLVQISPILVLVATILSLHNLAASGELMGLVSLGISKGKIILIKLILLSFIFIILLLMLEIINPYLNKMADEKAQKKNKSFYLSEKTLLFKRENRHEVYFILAERVLQDRLEQVTVWVLDADFHLTRTFIAESAFFSSNGLKLTKISAIKQNKVTLLENFTIEGSITFEDFNKLLARPESVAISHLPALIKARSYQGFSTIFYEKYLYSRLTLFLTFITQLLIAFQGAYQLTKRDKSKLFTSLLLGLIFYLSQDLIILIFINLGLSVFYATVLARLTALGIILLKNGSNTRY